MTIVEFLLARIAEDEAVAREVRPHEYLPVCPVPSSLIRGDDRGYGLVAIRSDRVLAECEAKRRIIEFHEYWPTLVEGPTEFTPPFEPTTSAIEQTTFTVMRQMAWLTDQEYRKRFGTEPPTGPMLVALAEVYAQHPDFESWLADTPN